MNETQKVNFLRPELCHKTHPLTCSIKGENIPLDNQGWAPALMAITEWLIAKGSPNIASLQDKAMYGNYEFFLPSKINANCYLLSNGKWLNTRYAADKIVIIIGNLCRHCGLNLNDIVITYEAKDASRSSKAPKKYSRSKPQFNLDPAIIEKLTKVLSKRFPNGYMLDSPIELTRFRSFAAEDLGEEISLSDDEIKTYISACGIVFEDKVYIVSAQTKEQIKKLAQEYIDEGAKNIVYAEFYAKNENYLFNAGVVSAKMLNPIFVEIFPDWESRRVKSDDIEKEILRIWGDDVLLTCEQIDERLRYISIKDIKSTLRKKPDFICNGRKTNAFTHISKVDIPAEECEAILLAAIEKCKDGKHISFADLPLMEALGRNPELSIEAIYSAVFRLCLSEKFNRSDKLIALKNEDINSEISDGSKGSDFDSQTIMENHCRTIERCCLDDLVKYQREQIGEFKYPSIMKAANEIMVRIDKETFIADRLVNFDIDGIDAAIEASIKDAQYLPLKSFTTFAAFAHCGYAWNLFLLESYCRRFSKKFRFDNARANSRNTHNTGVIVRESSTLNYEEIMADAIAKSDTDLNVEDASAFLYENGYAGTRRDGPKIYEIINKAKAIRDRRH